MSQGYRADCPECDAPRWARVDTNGNGGTVDHWGKCDNPQCPSNQKEPAMQRDRGQRLTPEERETVMSVLRANRGLSNQAIADKLATGHGITISSASIAATYRPKVQANGNGRLDGNGAHTAAAAVLTPPARIAPPVGEIDALPYQIYQLEDGQVQVSVDIATTPKHALAIIAAVNNALQSA